MPDEDPRPAARAKLDDAIREYAGAMYIHGDELREVMDMLAGPMLSPGGRW